MEYLDAVRELVEIQRSLSNDQMFGKEYCEKTSRAMELKIIIQEFERSVGVLNRPVGNYYKTNINARH